MALYFDTVCHTGFGYVRGSRSGKIKYVFFFVKDKIMFTSFFFFFFLFGKTKDKFPSK